MKRFQLIALLYLVVALYACRKETRIEKIADPGYYGRTKFVLEDYQATTSFNTFLKQYAPTLADSLATTTHYTVMAPDNVAFKIMLQYTLFNDTLLLQRFIRFPYYVLKGDVKLSDLPAGLNHELTALNGNKLWVSKWVKGQDTTIAVNGSFLSLTDAPTSNGYINILKRTYNGQYSSNLVDVINNEYKLSFFAAALQHTQLDNLLRSQNEYTVIAPDNNAFQEAGYTSISSLLQLDKAELTNLLKNHILPGRRFLTDMEMELGTSADTLRLNALSGNTVRAFMAPSNIYILPNSLSIYLLGPNNNYSPWTMPFTNKEYVTTFVAGNGVIHTSKLVIN